MSRAKRLLCIPLLLWGTFLFAQNRTITGKVTSSRDGAPVGGVTISLRGSSVAAATTADGSFSLLVPSGKVILQVSSIGYATKDVQIDASQSSVSIKLDEDKQQLGEVVVTALGIQRQAKTLVYATQTVKPSELTEA